MKWNATAAAAAANNRVLMKGELGYTRDDNTLKMGDGVTAWNTLDPIGAAAALDPEEIQDLIGAMVSGNTETNVTVTYDDTSGKLNFVVSGTYTDESIQDLVGGMVTGNTETNITVTYDDTNGKLDFVVPDASIQDTSAAVITNGNHTGVTTAYNATTKHLDLAVVTEDQQDIVGAMVSGNTETRIAVTYDDTAGKLNFAVDAFPVVIPFSLSGSLSTGAGTKRFYNPTGRTVNIKKVQVHAVTAPTGAAILVDVNINGTTIFTTQGNRPSIAISGNASTVGIPDSGAAGWDDTEYVTVDIDQIGSTVAGSDLTGIIYGEI